MICFTSSATANTDTYMLFYQNPAWKEGLMIMRIKWRRQLKINSENEAAPSASKLAFTLAAAICTEFFQILRTASLHPKKQRLPQQPGTRADERGAMAAAARNHCCIPRTIRAEKKRTQKQKRAAVSDEICRHYSRHQKQFSEPSTATVP